MVNISRQLPGGLVPQVKSRIDCEIDLIFSLYKKQQELSEKNLPSVVRLANDPDKWKKKFLIVFNREKVIDFTGTSATPSDYKQLSLNPVAMTKEGKKVLA